MVRARRSVAAPVADAGVKKAFILGMSAKGGDFSGDIPAGQPSPSTSAGSASSPASVVTVDEASPPVTPITKRCRTASPPPPVRHETSSLPPRPYGLAFDDLRELGKNPPEQKEGDGIDFGLDLAHEFLAELPSDPNDVDEALEAKLKAMPNLLMRSGGDEDEGTTRATHTGTVEHEESARMKLFREVACDVQVFPVRARHPSLRVFVVFCFRFLFFLISEGGRVRTRKRVAPVGSRAWCRHPRNRWATLEPSP